MGCGLSALSFSLLHSPQPSLTVLPQMNLRARTDWDPASVSLESAIEAEDKVVASEGAVVFAKLKMPPELLLIQRDADPQLVVSFVRRFMANMES